MTSRDPSASGVPIASRLRMPEGYETDGGASELLPWAHAEGRLERAENYWLATVRPDGRPHVTPLWGVWVEGALYLDGIPTALWARNLARSPAVAVHLESGVDVVILDGTVEDVERMADARLAARIVAAWDRKYGRLHPRPAEDGIFRVLPATVRAWSRFPHDATRWRFGDDAEPRS